MAQWPHGDVIRRSKWGRTVISNWYSIIFNTCMTGKTNTWTIMKPPGCQLMISPCLLGQQRQEVHGSCGRRTASPNAPPPRSVPHWTGRPRRPKKIAETLEMSMVFFADFSVYFDGCSRMCSVLYFCFIDVYGCSCFLIVQRCSWNFWLVKRDFCHIHIPKLWGDPKNWCKPQNPLGSNGSNLNSPTRKLSFGENTKVFGNTKRLG